MSNLENMIAEIKEQARGEAKKILDDIKEKNLNFSENEKEILAREREEILKKANEEGKLKQERIISNARLKARDGILFAKEEVVDRVFESALEKLKNIDEERYLKFVKNTISKVKTNKKIKILLTKDMKKKITEEMLDLKISSKTVESGCSIKDGKVIYNNEFTVLLDYHREELEKEVLEKIFK